MKLLSTFAYCGRDLIKRLLIVHLIALHGGHLIHLLALHYWLASSFVVTRVRRANLRRIKVVDGRVVARLRVP